jgi:hypothetical protein
MTEYRFLQNEEETLRAWAIEQAAGHVGRAQDIVNFVRPPKTMDETLAEWRKKEVA